MRHQRKGRKFGRTKEHRLAMFRNMTIALFTHGRIITTKEKAKETRRFAEKLITLGKEYNLHNFRRALQILPDKPIVRKLFRDIGPKYKERPGGYTRILQLSSRRIGDNGSRVIFELVEEEMPEKKQDTAPQLVEKKEETPAASVEENAADEGGEQEATEPNASEEAAETEAESGTEEKKDAEE